MVDFHSVVRQLLSQYRAVQPTAVTPEAVVNIVPASVALLPRTETRDRQFPSAPGQRTHQCLHRLRLLYVNTRVIYYI